MKKLVVVCAFALVCTPLAYGGLFGGLSRRKKERHIARQKEANLRFQEQATAFFDADAIPDYDSNLRELEQLTDLRSQTGAFSQFSSQSSRIPAYRLLEGGGLGGQRSLRRFEEFPVPLGHLAGQHGLHHGRVVLSGHPPPSVFLNP